MIVVRQVFQAKWGKAAEFATLVADGNREIAKALGQNHAWRVLTDLTGPFHRVVLEVEMESMAQWEQVRTQMFQNPEIGQALARGNDLVESGRSEIYTIEAHG
ncbi:MAG TPA: NIPSNAP family protein [Nitrolancea sp.]